MTIDEPIEDVRVNLISLGAVTHSFDMNQRLIDMTVVDFDDDSVEVYTPRNAGVAPPGWYMLHVLVNGVPSQAQYVLLQ